MTVRRVLKWLGVALGAIVLVVIVAGLWARSRVLASLAVLDGELALAGLEAEVTVERDALGVPTIRGTGRLDVARATGFVHAQERFFQMDLLRRGAAGELAALLGPALVEADRGVRVHRFRALAPQVLEALSPAGRALLADYAEGVNAGLGALGAPPPEYLVLRSNPEPWKPEDCVLVFYAMYLTLQGGTGRHESDVGLMYDVLPVELADFLLPLGSAWDAAIDGGALPPHPVPGASIYDLRSRQPAAAAALRLRRDAEYDPRLAVGSNNWTVAGTHTRNGAALLANDMHLSLGMPNIWYRADLVWTDGPGGEPQRITGVTLPGTPALVAGSNGHVAWGFTNSYGDWSDLIVLETDPGDDDVYLTADGPRRLERFEERIAVRGGEPEIIEVEWTVWGPVVDHDHTGRRRALRWVAHDAAANNMSLARMEHARDTRAALTIAQGIGIPAQNVVAGDRAGSIGWTIMGPIPRRVGRAGARPTSWASGENGWNGWLAPGEYPEVVDPSGGRIWTANNRVVSGAMLDKIGDGGFIGGARARQIRDGLLSRERTGVHDLLAIQLDDRAVFLDRWRALLLDVLTPEALEADPRRRELRRLVEQSWTGRASIDAAGYRLVRAFRRFLAEQVFAAITAPCRSADERFDYLRTARWEAPLWALVTEQPEHLLDSRFESWTMQLVSGVDATLEYFLAMEGPLNERTWGERNTVRLRHPISRAVPQLAEWLDVPPEALPGDSNMPRVQSPRFGASERMVVSPGHEAEGILHMPGGQSGHPWSPFYRKGHEAWSRGEPAPFLPGEAVHRLTLRPS